MKCFCGANSRLRRYDGKTMMIDKRLNQVSRLRRCDKGHEFPTVEISRDELQRLRGLAFRTILADSREAQEAAGPPAPMDAPQVKPPRVKKLPKAPRTARKQTARYAGIRDLVVAPGPDAGLSPMEAELKHNVSRKSVYRWRLAAAAAARAGVTR